MVVLTLPCDPKWDVVVTCVVVRVGNLKVLVVSVAVEVAVDRPAEVVTIIVVVVGASAVVVRVGRGGRVVVVKVVVAVAARAAAVVV